MRIEAGIEKFLKELEARGRSPFTLTHYRGHLQRFARWLEQREKSSDRSGGDLNLDQRGPKQEHPRRGAPVAGVGGNGRTHRKRQDSNS